MTYRSQARHQAEKQRRHDNEFNATMAKKNAAKEAIRKYANSQGKGWEHSEHDMRFDNDSTTTQLELFHKNGGGKGKNWISDNPHTVYLKEAHTALKQHGDNEISTADDWAAVTDYFDQKLWDHRLKGMGGQKQAPAPAEAPKPETVAPPEDSNHLKEAKDRAWAWEQKSQSGERAQEEFNPEAYNQESWDARRKERPKQDLVKYTNPSGAPETPAFNLQGAEDTTSQNLQDFSSGSTNYWGEDGSFDNDQFRIDRMGFHGPQNYTEGPNNK